MCLNKNLINSYSLLSEFHINVSVKIYIYIYTHTHTHTHTYYTIYIYIYTYTNTLKLFVSHKYILYTQISYLIRLVLLIISFPSSCCVIYVDSIFIFRKTAKIMVKLIKFCKSFRPILLSINKHQNTVYRTENCFRTSPVP